jgi:hypothetical protein
VTLNVFVAGALHEFPEAMVIALRMIIGPSLSPLHS